jgi:hypothetical protein
LRILELRWDKSECMIMTNGGRNWDCDQLTTLYTSDSFENKCYTNFGKFRPKFKWIQKNNCQIRFNLISHFDKDKKLLLYIYDSNELPSYPTSKLMAIPIAYEYVAFFYDKILFIRLPPPYETNCRDYNELIRSKA